LHRIREEETARPSVRLRRSITLAETALERRTNAARLPKLLHGELDWIAMKALEKDRTRRYATVNGLARDLERYLAGEPVEAAPPSAAYRLGKVARRHRAGLVTAAAFAVLLLAGAVVSSWMALRASRAEQEARAVNDFLRNDLLAQASANEQAAPDTKPDPDLKVRTALDRAANRMAGKFPAQPLVEASISQTIGDTYKDLGLYPAAQRHLERALHLRGDVVGQRHRDTLTSAARLAEVYLLQGKYAQAEPLYVNTLEVQRRVLGEEHRDTLDTMDGLGELYRELGKYAQAEPILAKVVDVRRRTLGENHPSTLDSMNNLATVYHVEGKYPQTEPLYIEVIERQRRVLGAEHPKTLDTMNNLGDLYRLEGKYDQAASLDSQVLEGQRRALGQEHPKTLIAMNHVAVVYQLQGDYAQAESLFTKVLEIQKRVLGQEQLDTLITMSNLAVAYRAQGEYSQAESLFTKTIEIQKRVLSQEHPSTLRTMSNLAVVYRAQGNYGQAESLFTKTLEIQKRVLGQEHPDSLRTLASLGGVWLRQNNYSHAESALRDALMGYERANLWSWERYDCQRMLGASMAGMKRFAEAEPLLLSGYEGILQQHATIPAESRRDLRDAAAQIVKLYEDWGKPDKAADWRSKLQGRN
jgi:tetratricopeptide (TPR) repeat protein